MKNNQINDKIVCVSGGFDPVHIGHLRMIIAAAKYGKVIAVINSDEWLMRKKGYIFMPFDERVEILNGFSCVHTTTHVLDDDGTVCEALSRIKPDFFANGGDRKTDNIPELQVCRDHKIELLWNMGGGKIQSSTELFAGTPMSPAKTMEEYNDDLKPSRIQILISGDVRKG